MAPSVAWETWLLGPLPSVGANKAGKLLNHYFSKNWSLILVFRLWVSMSLSLFVCPSLCMCLCIWMSYLSLCVCFFIREFFYVVTHMIHPCGLTWHSLCFVCKWLSMSKTLPKYVLLLARTLHSALPFMTALLSVCLNVSTFLFMSLCWACLWKGRQTEKKAPVIRPSTSVKRLKETTFFIVSRQSYS